MLRRLSNADLLRVKAELPIFKKVETATGVPWEMIASIWYRESFRTVLPKNATPGGPFQFDPPPSQPAIYNLFIRFSNLQKEEASQLSFKGINDFECAAFLCACYLRLKVKEVLNKEASIEVIKDAFWGYNGRAYGSADKSPYVMNFFDWKHINMIQRGSIPDGKGGRKFITSIDVRPGAFTVYTQLKALNW